MLDEWSEGEYSAHAGYYVLVLPTCRTCGKTGLRWRQVIDRKIHYELREHDGTLHVCDLSSALPNLEGETP